ncbi:MAG: DUF501 domain-containing protein [Ornithinimicrobium sp.]|uniref:DUF501 domain-containing protein n=1 Tax=Ornithinimicrobium sp. TaxID=1977084 RepID=UPI0026E02125|nr:DUF501 domain-containing protein [Ornithinimicrobium sp.]MDO5740953.1 DUF501 domain-containing protein [Ornithinimicrobium sp.]
MSNPDRSILEGTPNEEDLRVIGRQLGRPARGVVSIAHRCPCGCPTVVRTEPRLPDGTPFPTSFYATCPRLTAAISTLESSGLMKEMTQRLGEDEALNWAYSQAHDDYLRRREELAHVPEIAGISAGGMPNRVKCLHVLVAHALAAGPGVNPFGDEAIEALPQWWENGCCGALDSDQDEVSPAADTCPRHHPLEQVGATEGEPRERVDWPVDGPHEADVVLVANRRAREKRAGGAWA